jgi:hypothetical protein
VRSYNAHILYSDIHSIRQHAERQAYFGGLIRRTVYRFSIRTLQDETIVLNNVYRRIAELGTRLEQHVNSAIKIRMDWQLAQGQAFDFAATLSVTPDGLREGERVLHWEAFGGYRIQRGNLHLLAASDDSSWFSIPLSEVDNLTLLLGVLNERKLNSEKSEV